MKNRSLGRGFAAFASSMVVVGPALTACVAEPSYEDWAATDGAAGRINLDDVQDAFKRSESVTDFEDRVNRIYEGDGIILIRVAQDGDRMHLEAFEDLDKNGEIGESSDDQLFSIVKDHDKHEMRGHGANGYYGSHFGTGNFLFTYLMFSSIAGRPYSYHTTPVRHSRIRQNRASYRKSATYGNQLKRNHSYNNQQKKFKGSQYTNAGRNISKSRQSYQSVQKSSGQFKSMNKSASRFGSRGSTRGGGGSNRIIGFERRTGRT